MFGWPVGHGPRPAGRGHDKYRFQGDPRRAALRRWSRSKGTGRARRMRRDRAAPAGGAATIGPMPIYEFLCEACGARFEELVDAGTESVDCGACASQRTRRVYSPQGRPFRIVKTPGDTRQQERRNAQLRERTKQRFGAARRQARRQGGDVVSESREQRRERLVEVYREASVCTKCPLSETRTNVVFGSGDADANLMFVGEAPGAEEDRQGLPVRRPRRRAADRAAGGDRDDARGGLDNERVEVPAARQPRPAADRDRVLPAVHLSPGGADRAAGGRDARQLRHQAADREPRRDHQGAGHPAGATRSAAGRCS